MAIGDAASAQGLQVWNISDPAQPTYENLNVRGDELAAHITDGTHPFTKITGAIASGQLPSNIVTAAKINAAAVTTAKIDDLAVTAAKIATAAVTTAKIDDAGVTGPKIASTVTRTGTWTFEAEPVRLQTPSTNHRLDVGTSGVVGRSTVKAELSVGSNAAVTLVPSNVSIDATAVTVTSPTINLDASVAGGVIEAEARRITLDSQGCKFEVGYFAPHADYRVYSDGIRTTTTGASANMRIDDSNGVIQRSTSSRRYKSEIEDAPPMPTLLDVRPRTWRDKANPESGVWFGAIAEELHDLGLSHLVSYDDKGAPEAIAYDRVAIALIPLIRDLAERVAALEPKPKKKGA